VIAESAPSRRDILAAISAAGALGTLPAGAIGEEARLPTLREGRGQFVEFEPAALIPDFALEGRDGRRQTLHAFLGRALVVNFWATWCPPCRQELPLLDALNRASGATGPRAIAISIDREGRRAVDPYLASLRLSALPVFLDPEFRVARRAEEASPADPFRLFGLPLSYLLTPTGRNLGYFSGLVDWTSPAAMALLAAAAARG
jgi:thiol-disulfide isomerase/thioredoxin